MLTCHPENIDMHTERPRRERKNQWRSPETRSEGAFSFCCPRKSTAAFDRPGNPRSFFGEASFGFCCRDTTAWQALRFPSRGRREWPAKYSKTSNNHILGVILARRWCLLLEYLLSTGFIRCGGLLLLLEMVDRYCPNYLSSVLTIYTFGNAFCILCCSIFAALTHILEIRQFQCLTQVH